MKAVVPSPSLSISVITASNLFFVILSIWTVEGLLSRNMRGMANAVDNQWTFGQIAALILLIGPVFSFGRLVVHLLEKRRGIERQETIPFIRTGTMSRAHLDPPEALKRADSGRRVWPILLVLCVASAHGCLA